MSVKQYHHGDLKVSLIAAANLILQRDGANSLSLRAIAAEVGVSHMAPYAHFKNKNVLLKSVVENGFIQMASEMERCAESLDQKNHDSSMALVLAYGVSYLQFATTNPQLYRLMLGQVETSGRKKKASSEFDISDSFTLNSKRPFVLLREAFALAGGSDDKTKARALGAWSMVHGMAALMIEGHIRVPEGTSLEQFLLAASGLSDTT
jgi:AcrR family transcriptional regulator